MRCLSPIFIKNNKYRGCVPCGKCPACRQTRSQQWIFRLEQQARSSYNCKFITLTYNDDNIKTGFYTDVETGEISQVPVIDKSDVQDFIKDLRRELYGDSGGDLKYFVASEYGPTTHRPHYHCIIFNFPILSYRDTKRILETSWDKGFIQVADLNNNRIAYVCKYCLSDSYVTYLPVTNLVSHGIGLSWLTPSIRFSYRHNPRLYVVNNKGFKVSMPRYYREKLWSTWPEKEKLRYQIKIQQDEKSKAFRDYLQNVADSRSTDYQDDGCEIASGVFNNFGFLTGQQEMMNIQRFLAKYYNTLKRSKFDI